MNQCAHCPFSLQGLLGGKRCYSAAAAKGGLSISGVSDIIAVASGKGGVGKSTTAGLIWSLSKFI
jgi:ATP-binding protein involved in chromosome partitioning